VLEIKQESYKNKVISSNSPPPPQSPKPDLPLTYCCVTANYSLRERVQAQPPLLEKLETLLENPPLYTHLPSGFCPSGVWQGGMVLRGCGGKQVHG